MVESVYRSIHFWHSRSSA